MIKILGAGLSGLTAAINLTKSGKEVTVYEKFSDVGLKIKPNTQILDNWSENDILKKIKDMNINLPKINPVKEIVFYSSSLRKARLIGDTKPVGYFIQRGGKESFEYQLYGVAKGLGANFIFNSSKSTADIIATGAKRMNAFAIGGTFKGVDFQENIAEVFIDYNFCPFGYMYLIPHDKRTVSFLISTLRKIDLQPFFEKTIKCHKIIKEKFKDAEMIHKTYGFINYNAPKSAIRGKSLLVGEAAGFQDAMFGFGMKYAFFSGYFAAKSIVNNLNYDILWKESFEKELKLHILGNKVFDKYSNNIFWDNAIKKFGNMSVETFGKLWRSKLEAMKFGVSVLKGLKR